DPAGTLYAPLFGIWRGRSESEGSLRRIARRILRDDPPGAKQRSVERSCRIDRDSPRQRWLVLVRELIPDHRYEAAGRIANDPPSTGHDVDVLLLVHRN